MRYDHELGEPPECGVGLALWAEGHRLAMLLETLADDHFPDQAAFHAWIQRNVAAINREVMSDPQNSLADELPREQARARELLSAYREIGPVGVFGATMIEQALQRADTAASSGDVVAMIQSLSELRELA